MSANHSTEANRTDFEKNERAGEKIKKKTEKSKKPTDSDFKLQRLKTWNPNVPPSLVILSFFLIGIGLAITGVILRVKSGKIPEITIDYTDCLKVDENGATNVTRCADEVTPIKNRLHELCKCRLSFILSEPIVDKVFIYYKLTNFYQNHRSFYVSRSLNQLAGDFESELETECAAFRYHPVTEQKILPCGAVANSLFNDTLRLVYSIGDNDGFVEVPLSRTGIAWPNEKHLRYFNQIGLKEAVRSQAQPVAWRRDLMGLDPLNPSNNGFQNEDLIVWMRNEALNSFRKLYRLVDHASEIKLFEQGLPSGRYVAEIEYNYPVEFFQGTKSFIITTTTKLGGKNNSIFNLYMVVGGAYFVVGTLILITYLRKERGEKSD